LLAKFVCTFLDDFTAGRVGAPVFVGVADDLWCIVLADFDVEAESFEAAAKFGLVDSGCCLLRLEEGLLVKGADLAVSGLGHMKMTTWVWSWGAA
jgi:hypothetical protein